MASIKDTADSMETPANTPPPTNPIDTRIVRKLADILKDTGLSEIEVEQGELRIRVARELTVQAAPQVYTAPAPQATAAPAPVAAPPAAPAPAAPAPPPPERKGELVKSPMVGTIYLQATPGTPPFVKPGDKVTQGQTLMIVEAMKTMNPIPAPRAGTVVEILVEDSQPVEYGAPLVVLE
jgi:acetyl-CoA carboxylase biotin carboxyl carrier protein